MSIFGSIFNKLSCLTQRDHIMLHITEYFAKSLKVTEEQWKLHI